MPVQIGAAPQHGFDQPLGLLSDCHRRSENFLGILAKVAASAGEALDPSQRQAVETALAYFRTAAPRHNEDEEGSLFPMLRDSPAARQALESIEHLEHDHAAAAPAHQEVDRLFSHWIDAGALAPEHRRTLSQLLHDLGAMYQKHIEVEDRQIFPLAARLLDDQQLHRLGAEMANRRGFKAALTAASTPKGDQPMTATSTIDVRKIPGPQRHPLIFRTFEDLQVGQAMEIVNDHDPFPLHNQFNFMKRGQFTWTYLQQGPDLWRVQIARQAPAPTDAPAPQAPR